MMINSDLQDPLTWRARRMHQ